MSPGSVHSPATLPLRLPTPGGRSPSMSAIVASYFSRSLLRLLTFSSSSAAWDENSARRSSSSFRSCGPWGGGGGVRGSACPSPTWGVCSPPSSLTLLPPAPPHSTLGSLSVPSQPTGARPLPAVQTSHCKHSTVH